MDHHALFMTGSAKVQQNEQPFMRLYVCMRRAGGRRGGTTMGKGGCSQLHGCQYARNVALQWYIIGERQ